MREINSLTISLQVRSSEKNLFKRQLNPSASLNLDAKASRESKKIELVDVDSNAEEDISKPVENQEKPKISHLDCIIEEYINMRQINFDLEKE